MQTFRHCECDLQGALRIVTNLNWNCIKTRRTSFPTQPGNAYGSTKLFVLEIEVKIENELQVEVDACRAVVRSRLCCGNRLW